MRSYYDQFHEKCSKCHYYGLKDFCMYTDCSKCGNCDNNHCNCLKPANENEKVCPYYKEDQ